jgi:hypothetical protein
MFSRRTVTRLTAFLIFCGLLAGSSIPSLAQKWPAFYGFHGAEVTITRDDTPRTVKILSPQFSFCPVKTDLERLKRTHREQLEKHLSEKYGDRFTIVSHKLFYSAAQSRIPELRKEFTADHPHVDVVDLKIEP